MSSERKLLEQIFVNLITNAIHAVRETGEDTEVKINSDIEIGFKDNGVGIPVEVRAKIFDLFYTTRPPGRGTGLGLSWVGEILDRADNLTIVCVLR